MLKFFNFGGSIFFQMTINTIFFSYNIIYDGGFYLLFFVVKLHLIVSDRQLCSNLSYVIFNLLNNMIIIYLNYVLLTKLILIVHNTD